jgi:hypothetical protein
VTPSEWISAWVTIGSCIGACVVSLIGGTWILSWKMANIGKETEKKIGRIYERLDQYKTFIESKIDGQLDKFDNRFVCQTVCNILHTKTAEQVAEIKAMMAEGFKRLEDKIDKR